VFVVVNGHAEFRKVETGITGSTDIESITGLKEGEEIVTGSYKAIRTLRNLARLKVDNRTPAVARAQ
jgi:HlyD family secretion protein